MKIYFVTSNPHKLREARQILKTAKVTVSSAEHKINERQIRDTRILVREKALEAFGVIGRPLFVEHTVLELEKLNGLPGGLTQIFWDTLEADRFCQLFGGTSVIAKTIVGYIDGRSVRLFAGAIKGTVAIKPKGAREFQWDCVFKPAGHDQTFAEMGKKKNEISMRRRALDKFAQHLKRDLP